MYKYRDTQKIDITPTTETGSIVSFDNTSEMVEIQNVLADIEAVQDGTPWQSSLMQVPYIFQRTPQLGHDYNKEFVNAIVGGTVAWNQLVANSGSVSVTVPSGHKYYSNIGGTKTIANSDGSAISATGGTDNTVDLTALFGSSTIADYLYSLEQTTAGSGIAKLKEWGFDIDTYHQYQSGSLQSVNVSAHETVGFNQWDEEWEVGYFNNGVFVPSTNHYVCSKNLISVIPSTNYYFNIPANKGYYILYYDANGDYLRYDNARYAPATFQTSSDAHFVMFQLNDAYGRTYNNDICINISDASRNGEYEPYIKHLYPLDESVTLRGLFKLDANNNLYADGDVYEADGTITRKYNIVDLGTLNWYNDGVCWFTSNLPPNLNYNSAISNVLQYGGFAPSDASSADTKKWYWSGSGYFEVYVPNASTAQDIKSAMSGVYLVYEKATPTTETADPYTAIQTVDPYGTEEYIDYGVEQGTRDIAVPVGHQTRYALPVAISGFDEVKVYVSPTEDAEDATVYTVSLASAGTIYGGTLDVIKGELTVTHGYIESYDGETINEPWISSYDPYVSGATPTEGAQVVYPLTTPTTYVLTQEQIEPLIGPNNIWTDTGDITVTYANNPILLNTLPTEAVSINGRYLEKTIDGYSTLYVKGRESLGIDLSTYSVGTAHGEKIKGSRYPARTLTVGFQLLCANEQEFRFRFNQLNNILSIGEADFIFHDEEDKFFTGTPIMDAAIEPGRNCVTGEWKIYCAYPFKRSVEPIVLTSEDEEGVVISGNTATFTFDYKGVMPARPLLRCAFASAKTDGDYNEDGDCGFVAFLNQDESIIQLGNPEVIDVDELNKNGTLINSEFDALTNWTPSGIVVGNISDPYWAGGKGQTMAFAKGIGTLSRSTSGAVGFEFDIVHRLCVSAAAQTGSFKVSMKNGNDTVVGFIIEKTGSGTTGTVKYIVNNKVVGTDNIDLSYYNTSFGYCRRDPVYVQEAYQVWEEYQYFYYVKKKVKGKKKKVKVWATAGNWVTHTRTVQRGWRYTQSNLNSGISRDGGVVTFSIGNLADRTFKDSEIENTACYDVVFETTGSFHTNAVRSCAFIRKAGVPFAEIPNVFTAGDVVQADCSDATVYLYRAGSTEGHLEPQYGALGNDWEDFEVKVGTNIIRAAWSDWVDEDYRPKIEIAFNEVFI